MAQVINTNVSSLFAQQALNRSSSHLQTAMQRLSSGMRINSAKDDPTGLVSGTTFDSQMRGANMALRNTNDGIALAQTNDGYAGQIVENLQRIREIAVQQGGTASSIEATSLVTENTRILGLMNATTSAVVNNQDGSAFSTTGVAPTIVAGLGVTALDTALTAVNTARANYGADMAVLSSAAANLGVQAVNLAAQYSRVMDTDYAVETTNMTRNQILQQAGTAMLAQANQVPNTVLTLLK